MDTTWDRYIEWSKNQPPRQLLRHALPHVKERGVALDLGAGALNDAMYLLRHDFRAVIAVDKNRPKKDGIVEKRIAEMSKVKFAHVVSSFDDFHFDVGFYDLVNAQYSLLFTPKASFKKMFERLIASLKPGGIFVGQLFGEGDSWNDGSPERTFLSRAEAARLFHDCTMIEFKEVQGLDPRGDVPDKHWHAYHIIARKN